MLLRNMDPIHGHVNGSVYIVTKLSNRIIQAKLISDGPNAGNEILIPRILFHPDDKTLPFQFERRQFPIRPCFSMTANKSQGQSKKVVGVNVTKDFFGHGQLYVAMSRVTNPNNLKIFKSPSAANPNHTKNVVYKAVLSNGPNGDNMEANESTFNFDSDDEWMFLTQNETEDIEPIMVREELFGTPSEDEFEFED